MNSSTHSRTYSRSAGPPARDPVREEADRRLLAEVPRHDRAGLDPLALQEQREVLAREAGAGPDRERIAEPDRARAPGLAPRREREPVGVLREGLVPVLRVLAPRADERLEPRHLMDAEGTLELGRPQVVAEVHEEVRSEEH